MFVGRSLALVAALSLLTAETKPTSAPGKAKAKDLVAGAVMSLVGSFCSDVGASKSIEWTTLHSNTNGPWSWGLYKANYCPVDGTVLFDTLAFGALWVQKGESALDKERPGDSPLLDLTTATAAFKSEFGWSIPTTEKADAFNNYDAKNLQTLFDRVYVKPSEKVGAYSAQEIYDALLKDYATNLANNVAFIEERVPKAKMAKLAKDYQDAAKKGGNDFYGPNFLRDISRGVVDQEVTGDVVQRERLLGTILRRQMDGTWPTVIKLLKKVLQDYDPKLSKEVGAKL
jgi:hypothetical protein